MNVTTLPPLPRIPAPPRLPPDPRQRATRHALGAIATVASRSMTVAGPNLNEGFHASAVDLGRVQDAAERALRHFTRDRLEERWDDVFEWLRRFLHRWVQRRKELKIERHDAGIHIEVVTQDDLGYYRYSFDIFPMRGAGRGRSPTEGRRGSKGT